MMQYENDGVQYVFRNREFYNLAGHVEREWLPPLYPYQWSLWTGTYLSRPQFAICLLPPICDGMDRWENCVAEGSWSELWPLFLAYVNFTNVKENQ